MGFYKRKFGKFYYRNSSGDICVVKAGEILECEPEFLGNHILSFQEVEEGSIKKRKKVKTVVEDAISEAEDDAENEKLIAKKGKKFKRKEEK